MFRVQVRLDWEILTKNSFDWDIFVSGIFYRSCKLNLKEFWVVNCGRAIECCKVCRVVLYYLYVTVQYDRYDRGWQHGRS